MGNRRVFAVWVLALAATACNGTSSTVRKGPSVLEAREYQGEEAMYSPPEGQALLRKSKPLKEKAFLYVEATPPEAQIRVDGALKGTGTAMITEGKARFRLVSVTARGTSGWTATWNWTSARCSNCACPCSARRP